MDNEKPSVTRRIDLSNCKLLSAYGRNLADPTTQKVKVGTLNKPGILTKTGGIVKIGVVIKPGKF